MRKLKRKPKVAKWFRCLRTINHPEDRTEQFMNNYPEDLETMKQLLSEKEIRAAAEKVAKEGNSQ